MRALARPPAAQRRQSGRCAPWLVGARVRVGADEGLESVLRPSLRTAHRSKPPSLIRSPLSAPARAEGRASSRFIGGPAPRPRHRLAALALGALWGLFGPERGLGRLPPALRPHAGRTVPGPRYVPAAGRADRSRPSPATRGEGGRTMPSPPALVRAPDRAQWAPEGTHGRNASSAASASIPAKGEVEGCGSGRRAAGAPGVKLG